MNFVCNYNANIVKILAAMLLIILINKQSKAQEDPITEALKEEKQEYLGAKLSAREYDELQRINTKYQLTEKELELRSKQRSGLKMGLMDRFRIGRANRKDYLRAKKLEKFRRKKVMSKQNEATRKRMKQNEKRANASYKKNKMRKKRKSFFNLFR